MLVELHPEARDEFHASVAYLNGATPGAGLRFFAALLDTLTMIGTYPRAGFRITKAIRRFSMPDWPYSIVYRIREYDIFVIAIAHERRSNRYWRDRLEP